MVNDFKHLEFPKVIKNKAKIPGGGNTSEISKQNRTNRIEHSTTLKKQLISVFEQREVFNEERRAKGFTALPLEVPLLLKMDEDSYPIDDLYKYGLEVVSEEENGYVIVATNEAGLNLFQEKLETFKQTTNKGISISGSGKIAEIHEINTQDLPSKRLSEYLFDKWPFKEDSIFIVDISIECKGLQPFVITDQKKRETDEEYYERVVNERNTLFYQWENFIDNREDNLFSFLEPYDGQYEILVPRVMDNYSNEEPPEYFDLRIKLNGKILKDLTLNYPYVFEINEPDNNVCEIGEPTQEEKEIDFSILPPEDDDPIVCVIDSGIQEAHRYIQPAILQDRTLSFVELETSFDEYHPNGHGTRVAGKILYPESLNINGDYQLPCWIQSTKILNKNCFIPENKHTGQLMKDIVESLKQNIKIYNQSINSLAPCRTKHMSSWAAEIDLLSYKHDVLFIQSAGNIHKETSRLMPYSGIKNYLENGKTYPNYLYEEKSSRISNPAQSMFALTVGSIASGEYFEEVTGLKSIENIDHPSSFSRSGFGLWGSIKPDVVEYGGGYIKSDDNNLIIKKETSVELLRTSPPGPAYAKDDVGTSYSTPKVSHIAAEIQKLFPHQSTLLYRALIAHSAKWPNWTDDLPNTDKLNIFKSMGYGIPNLNDALNNNEYKITFTTAKRMEINVKDAHLYHIPIPESLNGPGQEKDIKVTVTLAYTAKPRRTRMNKKGYLSSWLEWDTSKPDEPIENVKNRTFTDGSKHSSYNNEPWYIASKSSDGIIKGISRNDSTLQKDWRIIKSYNLPEKFAIAIKSHQGWDRDPFSKAYYSLVVSFEAINNDIKIYEAIKNEVELELEASTQEIENEIGI